MQTNLYGLWALMPAPTALPLDDPFHPFTLEIFGLTVMERTLRALEKAGVQHIIFFGEEENGFLEKLTQQSGSWKTTFSFLKRESWFDAFQAVPNDFEGKVIFLSEPLVFDFQLVQKLSKKYEKSPGGLVTACKGRIALADPAALHGLKNAVVNIPNQINQHHLRLALLERFAPGEPCRISGCKKMFCISPTNEKELEKTKKRLLQSLVKPNDGWVSRHLNRPLSTLVSRALVKTSITPNQITLFMLIPALLTGFVFAQGGHQNFLIGAILFHLTSVLDGVDGEIARLKFKSSPFGQ